MYLMLVATAFRRRVGATDLLAERRRETLRFVTVAVDQVGGGAPRQPDVRPVLERVTCFHRWMQNAGSDESPIDFRGTRGYSDREAPARRPQGRGRSPKFARLLQCAECSGSSCLSGLERQSPCHLATCGYMCNDLPVAISMAADRALRVRRPATINRYLSLLQHFFNWAMERDYIRPFRRNSVALVRQEREDNRRHRRIEPDEERALLSAAPDHLRPLIVFALDTGMRRGEMLTLTWADVDARPNWLRVRGEAAQSRQDTLGSGGHKTSRRAPGVSAPRCSWATEVSGRNGFHRRDRAGPTVPAVLVARNRAQGARPPAEARGGQGGTRRLSQESRDALQRIDLHWHDLRHEYASRLVERRVPLSQMRDLLGHASIVTTERYDYQKPEALTTDDSDPAAKPLEDDELAGGVDDGTRTRSLRSHSPAL